MIVSIAEAIKILKHSGIVGIPTETVYGLAAVATDKKAIEKVFKAKNRPADNPLICHFHSLEQIQEYVPQIPICARTLISELTPGPISILLTLPENSPLNVATAGMNSVICRIPNQSTTLEIIKKINLPLAAPSANSSGRFSATTAQMVEADLGKKINGVVDGGKSNLGIESTIVDCRTPEIVRILRPGLIGSVEIQEILKKHGLPHKVISNLQGTSKETTPGSKYPHYAPKTPVYKFHTIAEIENNSAILGPTKVINKVKSILKNDKDFKVNFIDLGPTNLEIASNLYEKLFELDKMKVKKAFIILDEIYSQTTSVTEALKNRIDKILNQ